MTAKEYLNQAFYLDRRINSKLDMLATFREMAAKTTGVMQDDVVSHTRNVHALEDTVAKIVDMQSEINMEIDRLVNTKQEILRTIQEVQKPDYQMLLELRYICFRSWEEIADRLCCTVSNVYKMHAKALQEVIVPKYSSSFQ